MGLAFGGGSGLYVASFNSGGGATVGVSDSVAANNNSGQTSQGAVSYGFRALSENHSPINLSLTRSQIVGNDSAVGAIFTNATVWLTQSTMTGNAKSISVDGGIINSFGDNSFVANGSSTSSLTPVGKN